MDAELASSRNAGFEEVMQELLEKADNKESFGIVLTELLSKKDEIAAERERANEERAKVAKLEAVLVAKEEMERKHETLRERYEEARDAERKEVKEVQASLMALMKEERKETQAQQKLLMEDRKEAQALQQLLMKERKEERREAQERKDLLMVRLFEQQGKQTEKIHRRETGAAQNYNGNTDDASGITKTQIHMAGPPALIPTPTPQDIGKTRISKADQNPAPDEQEALRAVSFEAGLEKDIHDGQQQQ